MTGQLLLQLSFVALAEADAIEDTYAWPPRSRLTDEEECEASRLRSLSARLAYRAAEKGWTCGTHGAFAKNGGGT